MNKQVTHLVFIVPSMKDHTSIQSFEPWLRVFFEVEYELFTQICKHNSYLSKSSCHSFSFHVTKL